MVAMSTINGIVSIVRSFKLLQRQPRQSYMVLLTVLFTKQYHLDNVNGNHVNNKIELGTFVFTR